MNQETLLPPHVRTATTDLAPFRGWRYADIASLSEVLVPPYDVITPVQQRAYYERHPYNIIRLVLGLTYPMDSPTNNRYTRAATTLQMWQRLGILRRDDVPSYYILRQRFPLPGGRSGTRVGVIGRFRLRPWGEGIFPHEQTFPGTKADRIALLRATATQFSPVFALSSVPSRDLLRVLEDLLSSPPVARYSDDDGVEYELWIMNGTARVRTLREMFAGSTFYVADGHHRYETALAYQREMRARYPDAPPGSPFDYTLMYVAALDDPGVVILPPHRALDGRVPVSPGHVLECARAAYDLEPMQDDDAIVRWAESVPAGLPDIALVFPDGPGYKLHLRMDRPVVQRLFAEAPRPLANLAVFQLQRLVLGPGAGVGDAPEEQKQRLAFRPDARALVAETRAGRWDMVALVSATHLDQLRAIAEAGLIAPPKATYFYPKLPSGLVMYSVRE